MQVLDKIKEIFFELFNVEEEKVTEELTINDVEEWDSFGHLKLILEIESKFGIKFKTVDIPNLASIKEIINAVKNAL